MAQDHNDHARHSIVHVAQNACAMKRLAFLLPFIIFAGVPLLAQNPVPDADTASHPIKQGDPALKTLPPRLDYTDDRKRISAEELPPQVRQALDSDPKFATWHDATLFHDRNRDEYIVELTTEGKTTTHRFSRDGKLIIEK